MSAKRKDSSILSFFSKKVKQLDDVVSVDASESDVPLPQKVTDETLGSQNLNLIVKAELNLWKTKLSRIGKSPKNGLDAIKICNPKLFPNVHSLLKIFSTLPVSTATPERMFSCLKRLKTYLRNTMVENRLNGLATMAVHRGVVNITADEVLDELAKKNRKIDLII